jgi:hypothetical protein
MAEFLAMMRRTKNGFETRMAGLATSWFCPLGWSSSPPRGVGRRRHGIVGDTLRS